MTAFWGEIAPCDHILQIYETDDEFITTLEGFVTSGFISGESVVVIATTDHLKALNDRLRKKGFDLFSLTLQDHYIPPLNPWLQSKATISPNARTRRSFLRARSKRLVKR